MKTIRWGIIGCGDVTEKKSGPGFQKAQGSELVAVMRRNAELAKDYARRHKVPRWYDNADKLINDPDVDAIYIATPPTTHVDYIKRVARAGKPIYAEKPMGVGYAESREAVEACRAAGIPLHVAYYRRGMEKYRAIRELISEGRIGAVRYVHVAIHGPASGPDQNGVLPWRVRPELSGGGLLLDVGSHGLDLLDFCLGPIRDVEGFADNQAGNYQVEDMVSGAWVFASGVHGSGNWCFSADREDDRILIVGDRGRMEFSVLDVAGPVVISTSKNEEALTFDAPEHVQQPLIQLVTSDLLGTGESPSTGESALRTDRVLELLRSKFDQKE